MPPPNNYRPRAMNRRAKTVNVGIASSRKLRHNNTRLLSLLASRRFGHNRKRNAFGRLLDFELGNTLPVECEDGFVPPTTVAEVLACSDADLGRLMRMIHCLSHDPVTGEPFSRHFMIGVILVAGGADPTEDVFANLPYPDPPANIPAVTPARAQAGLFP
ncbi:hypothetical protein BJ508DRAFT_309151 [Ascobolus immersus RN42]|uniref:Uncharacterized protein n=1 Tax=Ascobolus immersus RN42 TaxID=1160509 RepID=A0A3N4HXC9_ASCIM|nr:hypothetical protein BJ508DRAFT_309151 [Ascobolus immersus RN42]